MAVPATQIRRGMVIVMEGDPCRVIEFRHHTPGNLRAMVQTKMKNLRTGSNFEHRFRAADSIEKALMETHDLEFLYETGGTYHFMKLSDYDQLEMDDEMLGDNAQWMQPGMKIQAEGEARQRRDDQRAGVPEHGGARAGEPADGRVPGSREGLSGVAAQGGAVRRPPLKRHPGRSILSLSRGTARERVTGDGGAGW